MNHHCAVVWIRVGTLVLAVTTGGAVVVHAQSLASSALPTGARVSAGQASVSTTGANMVINQSTQRAAIDWQSFNVGSGATVQFNQPNAQAATLNRVTGGEASTVLGRISAPGQVIISNGNGVLFGRGSSVDVGSLIATTHSIDNEAFMAGHLVFARNGATGSVVNQGELRARLEGFVALMAPEVRNDGAIVAYKGTVALAAGELVELQLDSSNKLSSIRVEAGQYQALVDNRQVIEALDGLVLLSARAVRELQGGVIKHSGSINASSMSSVGGRVVLTGDDITLQSGSRIQASGATGGGTVLVGGDWQGGNGVYQATKVSMEAGASIDASAIQQGDGGKVVLWSDVGNVDSQTVAQGDISARAGANSGHGGQVETSGHALNVEGIRVDVAANLGQGGHWLLDPANSTITQTVANSFATTLNGGGSVENIVTGDITWGSGVTLQKTTGGDATLMLKATNSIILNANSSISSSYNKLKVVLWSNSDEGQLGYIKLDSGSSIATNGGDIVMGGGAAANGLPGGYGIGAALMSSSALNYYYGLGLNQSTLDARLGGVLDANAGNITLRGKGTYDTVAANSYAHGISLNASKLYGNILTLDGQTTTTRTAGLISYGISSTGNTAPNNTQLNAYGDISLTGTAANPGTTASQNTTQNSIRWGFNHTMVSANGNILINAAGQLDWLSAQTLTLAAGKALIYNSDYNGTWSNVIAGAGGLTKQGSGTLNLSGSNTYSGVTTVSNGTLLVSNNNALGTTAGNTVIANGATLAVANGVDVAEPLQLAGNGVNSGGALNLLGTQTYSGAITLTDNASITGGTGTQTLSGTINGAYALDISSAGSWVQSGAIGNAARLTNVSLRSAGATSLGAISASGTIDMASLSGNLTLNGAIDTTNTSSSAIVLNAASNGNALVSTGGDVVVAGGSVSVGAGGRATLYSGSVSGSTGLTSLLGSGSGRFRYASDETTTGYSMALGSGVFAIYREQPTASITSMALSMTYGDVLPDITATGVVNADKRYDITSRVNSSSGNIRASATPYGIVENLSGLGYSVVGTTTGTLTVNAKALTMSGLTVPTSKTYDGQLGAAVSGTAVLQSAEASGSGNSIDGKRYTSDVVSITGAASGTYNSKDVSTASSVTFSGLSLIGADAGNYSLTMQSPASATITKANLSVTANNDARFVVGSDAPGFAGVSYSGFVHGETSGVLGGALVVTRSNPSTSAPGTYQGVLVPSGLVSDNYAFTYANGSYTIVPSRQLLVRVIDVSNTYGATTQYAISSVQYENGGTVYTLGSGGVAGSSVTINSSNVVSIQDGASGSASFTVAPTSAQYSTANKLKVGSYQLRASGTVTVNSGNFSDSLAVVGAHQVNTKGSSASASSVSKMYDGTSSVSGVAMNMSSLEAGDVVTVSGSGAFADKQAGTGLNYSLFNVSLTGADAGNYHLTGGTSFSGSNGVITAAPLTVTASSVSKIYDGVAYSGGNGVVYSGWVGGDTASMLGGSLTYGGTSQGATQVGSGYTIVPSGLSSTNYAISYAHGTLTINPSVSTPALVASVGKAAAASLPTASAGGVLSEATGKVVSGATGATSEVSVELVGKSGSQTQGFVSVLVPPETATAGTGFRFSLPDEVTQQLPQHSLIRASQLSGASLPSWLHFEPGKGTFEAQAVPDGAFPMQVMLQLGEQKILVMISERQMK